MMNKAITSIVVFLLILIGGGFGYYAFTLNQQVLSLSEQLTTFQAEQVTRIDAVTNELLTLRGEVQTEFGGLKTKIDENLTRIGSLEDAIEGGLAEINELDNKIDVTQAQIASLEEQIKDTTEFSQSIINAGEVYQKVSQATVRISNGERTIGSGFIFDSEAHVLTANHVVENLSQIYVVLPDGRISIATSTGNDLVSDVAVLRLEEKLVVEPLILADSKQVRIGEPVAAIGSPLDLTETLTTGIVSQVNRYTEINYNSGTRFVANLIQFDAAVNVGNSGCPLVNAKGEVIGMVIARVEPTEGDGIYYAVSSNKIKRVASSLIDKGSFDYPWLGVGIVDLTPQMAQERALETANGVLVQEVFSDSPAETAGIEVDDIIIAIDGVMVRDTAAFTSYLGEYKSPGETATLNLLRDSSGLELSIEIAKRP
jgi:S1-C subfamily serine protease